MVKNVANLLDSFYTLPVSTTEDDFKKVEHLQKCAVPTEEKVMDEVTATDDKRAVKAVVDFKEESEIEFEFVHESSDEGKKSSIPLLRRVLNLILSLNLSKLLAKDESLRVSSLSCPLTMKTPRKSYAKQAPSLSQAM